MGCHAFSGYQFTWLLKALRILHGSKWRGHAKSLTRKRRYERNSEDLGKVSNLRRTDTVQLCKASAEIISYWETSLFKFYFRLENPL